MIYETASKDPSSIITGLKTQYPPANHHGIHWRLGDNNVSGHQHRWLPGGYDLEIGHFQRWITWW